MVISVNYQKIFKLLEPDISKIKEQMGSYIEENKNYGQVIIDYFNSPSKYIRSIFSLLYLKSRGYKINSKVIKLLSAIELIHNGSLVHDDIIDKSETRRNKKTLYSKYGEHFSVIAGDFILSLALKLIADINMKDVTIILSEAISNMCKGEFSQYYLKNKIPTLEQYILKTYQKTGALFEAALCCSELILQGTILPQTKNISKNFGIAFQIKNDNKNVINISPDSDINNGIYTAAVIFAGKTSDLTSGIEKANNLLDNYLQEARAYILKLDNNIYKTSLLELLELLKHE